MRFSELFFLGFGLLGGLALFIFGMNVMTEGLKTAAGTRLRTVLSRGTRNRLTGAALGTLFGFLVHSSALTVMLVGFVNAGLMTLANSVPAVLGANVGTTISMQVISFKLDRYCFVAIAVGFLVWVAAPGRRAKHVGRALMGFGLLFLGMRTMSESIAPHREVFAPLLSRLDGSTTKGLLIGLLIAAAITAVIQSSGAAIGMCYALVSAGVLTELTQVYPLVMGARIGTCATALLASIGTNIDARRTAVSHLLFNVVNVAVAVAAAPLFLACIPFTSSDLVRQTANLHTAVMIVGVLIVLPVSGVYANIVSFIVWSRKPRPAPSFLDEQLLARPERAAHAAISELRRVAELSRDSMRRNADLLFRRRYRAVRRIRRNEQVINEIKLAMRDYLTKMTKRTLSRRQAILIQYINSCMTDIERIGDHVDRFADLSLRRMKLGTARFDAEGFNRLFKLYEEALAVIHAVIESLDPDLTDFKPVAGEIMKAADRYRRTSVSARDTLMAQLSEKTMSPVAGIFFSDYVTELDRTVKHAKAIALVESQPHFWIKRKKLDREAEEAPAYELPPPVDPKEFLNHLDY